MRVAQKGGRGFRSRSSRGISTDALQASHVAIIYFQLVVGGGRTTVSEEVLSALACSSLEPQSTCNSASTPPRP